MKVAILICDVPSEPLLSKFGDYGKLFTDFLLLGGKEVGCSVQTTAYNVMEGAYPPAGTFDAVLMTGSRHSAYEQVEWIDTLIRYIRSLEANVKIVGICFGHQIVAEACEGGRVSKSPKGWEIAHTNLELTERGREFFGCASLVHLALAYRITQRAGYSGNAPGRGE